MADCPLAVGQISFMDVHQATTALLQQDFSLDANDPEAMHSPQFVIELLAQLIEQALITKPEWLMSKLYTMDVAEEAVREALQSEQGVAPPLALARLVYERQRQRAYTKATFKPKPLDDEDLAW